MLRKILATLTLVPLAIVIIALAMANRTSVTVSLDPFDGVQPAYSKTMWLFVPIFIALIVGVLIGGAAAWLAQGKCRRIARRLEREAGELRGRLEALQAAAEPSIVPREQNPPPRLKLQPPARQGQ